MSFFLSSTFNKRRVRQMSTDELKEKSRALQLLIQIVFAIFMCVTGWVVFLVFQDIKLFLYLLIPSALLPVIFFSRSELKEIRYELNKRG